MFKASKQTSAGADAQPRRKLTRAQRREIDAAIRRAARTDKKELSAQESIPYQRIWPDGVCRVTDTYYTKTVQFQDINYQLSQNEDKNAIFEGWSDCLNYFDSSIRFQFSFLNLAATRENYERRIVIPPQGDSFDAIRAEYTAMLQNQLARGNNGLVKTKYLTFGVEAESIRAAKPRLERIETDIINNLKRLGVATTPLNGTERLRLLYDMFHMDDPEPFRFSWDWLAPSGLSTKDFIAPSSLEFPGSRAFRMGRKWGAVSFLQILAPELNDRILADFLDMESSLVVSMHIQSVDQVSAIKTIKRKITDLDRTKIEEQKKAVRSGYDMDIIPSDLATYGAEAKKLLQDLQSRNERMFLVTFLLMNTADSRKQLDNNLFQANSIAQKHNCRLIPLDLQPEEGLMSCLPLGLNQIEIQRGLTTSSTAIFVPFTTQELFQTSPEALYYGINALSNNLIMVDRKLLKNPNGLILGTPGCFSGETRIRMADGSAASFAELVEQGVTSAMVQAYDEETGQIVAARARNIRVEKYTDELWTIHLEDGSALRCTGTHLIMDGGGQYVEARHIREGQRLSGGHVVVRVSVLKLAEKVPVYDLTAPRYLNFVLENGLVVHNSGKSFSAKREITNVFLVTEDDVLICDPEDEYAPLVKRLGGQVVKISPTSTQYVNPMDINLNYSDDDNPLALKVDFLLSFCDIVVGSKDGLQPVEKTVIDRCVRNVYRPYLADPDPARMPILQDLYDELLAQPETEAQRIAAALELYVTGSLNVFNHRTNVELTNRLVCFNIKELGKQLKQLGMLVIQDQVWNRVTVNRAAGKTTRYYVDEFHLLLKGELASWSVEIWKRFRKWGGIPTGITQNIKDLLASREIENIFENSDFIYMLNQAAGDRQILAKQLNISPHQLSYVTHSSEGEGLLFYGNVILPFVDRFPKDTELYGIMTTKPREVAGQ
ncbi:PrgI family protein [Pseudoflavonifractor phocaeensis]|nr:PrgI family protein [Pseudoflavonifractor phocaeensis]MBM6723664.1 PrgI family protein [Pseudoflavonifractor phocaeensis]